MLYHRASIRLSKTKKPEKDVSAFFSHEPTGKAVIFIHGYKGDYSTWTDFPRLMSLMTECKGTDIYIYEYDGLRAELIASSNLFREFLDRLMSLSAELINEVSPQNLKRDIGFKYRELLVVGHSLGAVISRRALIDATIDKLPWVSKVKLFYFAPAHKGASILDLAIDLQEIKPIRFLKVFAKFESPLIDQLTKDSTTLADLLKDYDKNRVDNKNLHLRAHTVVVAEHEHIVKNDRFGDDPSSTTIPNTSHTSVCKPKTNFLDPLYKLRPVL